MRKDRFSSKYPLIFIHIPKTAGTSFRNGANEYFGQGKSCIDYGEHSLETSKIVFDWMINRTDPWKFKTKFIQEGYNYICGHFQARRYIQIFDTEHAVAFLREPLQRVASEYKHYVRHHNYKNKFEDFYRQKQFINRQSKIFQNIPWPALGFIGITEQYDASLELFNDYFNSKFKIFEENLGKSNICEVHSLATKQEKELLELNAEDVLFYQQACQQLRWRLTLAEKNKMYVRGMIGNINNRHLNGWAVSDKNDVPVKIEVYINNEFIGTAIANEARPHLKAIGLRRGGFVGFSLNIPSLIPGDKVTAIVSETHQPLANSPLLFREYNDNSI